MSMGGGYARVVRIGVLTGGGDCPGLNAVIRAVVRKGVQVHGDEFVGFRDGWRGPLEGDTMPLDVAAVRGILPARRHDPRVQPDQSLQADDGERRVLDTVSRLGVEASSSSGGRTRSAWPPSSPPPAFPSWGAKDHRQRSGRHRLHVRLRHCGDGRHRSHRPAAHDGGESPPCAHRRGHGTPHGLDRLAFRRRRGANVILIPERPFHIDEVCAFIEHRFASHYAPIVVVAEGARSGGGYAADRGMARSMPSAMCGSRASETCWSPRSPNGPVRKPVPLSLATSSVAVARPPSIGCSPPGSGCTPWTPCTTATLGRWWRCTGPRSTSCRCPKPPPTIKLVPPELYAEAEVFFG